MKPTLSITSFLAIICGLIFFNSACKKSDFLDAKPQTSLVIPTTVADYQALLEYDGTQAAAAFNVSPAMGNASVDDYYFPDNVYANLSVFAKNVYTWATDVFSGQGNQKDWNIPYKQIFVANIVLNGLGDIQPGTYFQLDWNATYGNALFSRAFAYWNLAQIFSPAYDSAKAATDLGVPLRFDPDINIVVQRATVQQTYDQIFKDLFSALSLVPINNVGHLNRAAKPAIYAFLSRVYLSMRNYNKALLYADSSLQLSNSLIDYNTLNMTVSNPFSVTSNVEVLYQACDAGSNFQASQAIVDSNLYKSYTANDLRSIIFFRSITSGVTFKYGYAGSTINAPFSGFCTAEMYLTRAECNARAGNTSAAMADLNTLLVTRWKKNGTVSAFVPYTANSSAGALSQILTERRKECVFRALRWMDLRRLNKEGYNITPQRLISGQAYTLAPNSNLYIFPIPPDEIALSGIQQNQRP